MHEFELVLRDAACAKNLDIILDFMRQIALDEPPESRTPSPSFVIDEESAAEQIVARFPGTTQDFIASIYNLTDAAIERKNSEFRLACQRQVMRSDKILPEEKPDVLRAIQANPVAASLDLVKKGILIMTVSFVALFAGTMIILAIRNSNQAANNQAIAQNFFVTEMSLLVLALLFAGSGYKLRRDIEPADDVTVDPNNFKQWIQGIAETIKDLQSEPTSRNSARVAL